MSFLQDYNAYLRDNPEHLWFNRKLFGWGWVPVRWQGWVSILIFITALVANTTFLPHTGEPTPRELLRFVGGVVVASALLIALCYKTGEKPRWQWGIPKK